MRSGISLHLHFVKYLCYSAHILLLLLLLLIRLFSQHENKEQLMSLSSVVAAVVVVVFILYITTRPVSNKSPSISKKHSICCMSVKEVFC